jgi:2-phospho-L-lactate/phosphoenolpyruvate guanylyltransferase
MRTAAILPVKRFSWAKQRLNTTVVDSLRKQLAQAMVADVMLALAQTASIEMTIVVTRESAAQAAASEHGAIVLADETESGQSAAASVGVRHALAAGIERVLCVPGDCPALDPAELDALLQAHAHDAGDSGLACQVVIVPDRHGSGTNGLLLAPPDAIAPAFGADSCARHRSLAHAAGLSCRVERPASLLLDIDTGADLAALRERLAASGPAGGPRAPRTRAVLGQEAHPQILSVSTPA